MFSNVIGALWFILPAYFANASALLFGGGRPIDFGRNFIDGKRLLGDGKTWRGFFAGILAGIMIALLQHRIIVGFLLALGALLGDIAESFFKRRLGIERGKPLPLFDQIDFVIGALALSYPYWDVTVGVALLTILITPPIHLGTNFIAYKLKLKGTPY